MNLLQLAADYPHAFQDLPTPYQADDCLVYWEEKGQLFATPKPDQTIALGAWMARYDDVGCEWVIVGTRKVVQ